jgi:hypothetical protein
MKPSRRFLNQPKDFWAHVRSISQEVGYTQRASGSVKVPSLDDVIGALRGLGLSTDHILGARGRATPTGNALLSYFRYRADVLNRFVEPRLMDAARAHEVFERLRDKYRLEERDIPWNKQKGAKRTPAYLTAIVGMIIRANARGLPCDFDPRSLTTVTAGGRPLRTLARRVDGAFPSVVNPVVVWEIKEYYHTTTFGSRVADGVYESLLDGMELEELRQHEGRDVKHYLMVDAHYTWWDCGRSYLCRLIDMLHMGYVDEVLFGHEVVERLPAIVAQWVRAARARPS